MHIKHIMLSIALCGPIVGTAITIPAHADAPATAENHGAYITAFFNNEIENFDAGYTIAGLRDSVSAIFQAHDSTQATAWNNIDIVSQPHEAAHLIIHNKTLLSKAGVHLPETEQAAYVKIKETIGWEFLDTLLFSNDEEIIKKYQKSGGWDELVTYIREVFAETPYADIAESLPLSKDFPYCTRVVALTRCSHVQGILEQHMDRFPKTLQNRKQEKGAETNARNRLKSVITQ